MSTNQAHLVIDYLLNRIYDITWNEASPREKLGRHLLVYEFAIEYQIHPLDILAFTEIQRLGDRMTFPALITALLEHNYTPSSEECLLANYVRRKGSKAHDGLDAADLEKCVDTIENTGALNYMIIESLIKHKLELQKYRLMVQKYKLELQKYRLKLQKYREAFGNLA
ncbi:hypothetical protein ACHAPU_000131 [Fusarium lateritium]